MPLTKSQIIKALQQSGGFISQAAKMLNVTRSAVYGRISSDPDIKAAHDEIQESYLDFSESKLLELVKEGNLGAICFYLKCRGKSRGYVERSEVTGADGGALTVPAINVNFVKNDKEGK